ncbi:MAG: stress response translation initiation inhibitor YciH [Candidatus Micrarchaeota archaeon]|nr:stress response translation initiation inhibitor YciH [Candidatus Micrarchaeota archaeon]
MVDICQKCGLIKEICSCDILEKEETQRIRVYATKKKFKKLVTIVEGIDKSKLEETGRELKQKLACGGTVKDGVIVLQGDQRKNIKKSLVNFGYPESSITVLEGLQ